jgi:hypothetical protein
MKEVTDERLGFGHYLGVIAIAQNRVADCVALLRKYIAMRPSNARNLKNAEDILQSFKSAK